MWKKLALGVFALLFALGSNMDLCCRVWVNGCEMPGSTLLLPWTKAARWPRPRQKRSFPGPPQALRCRGGLPLSLHPAEGDGRVLSDAALRSVTGVKLAQGVFINGVFLGCVADGPELFSRLLRLYQEPDAQRRRLRQHQRRGKSPAHIQPHEPGGGL